MKPHPILDSHDVVQLAPPREAHESMPLGNGRLVAMVHLPGPEMVWQLNHSDYWRYCPVNDEDHPGYGARPVGLGRFKLRTEDGLLGRPTAYEQRLCLAEGAISIDAEQASRALQMRAWMDMDEDVVVLHYQHQQDEPTMLTVELEGWRGSHQTRNEDGLLVLGEDAAPMRSPDEIAYLRKLLGEAYKPPINGFALALKVVGETLGEPLIFQERNRIQMKVLVPAQTSLHIYLGVEISRDQSDPSDTACTLAEKAASADYDLAWKHHCDWWENFWSQSYVRIDSPDAAAGYIENLWYLHLYQMAAGGRGDYPIKMNGGTWLYDGDKRDWGGGYWHFNQRHMHQAMFAANHLELARNYFDGLTNNLELIQKQTRDLWGHGGAFVHETHSPDGVSYWENRKNIPANTQWTGLVFSTGLEIAYQMVKFAQHLGDEAYLRDTVYPFIKETAQFYCCHLQRDTDGIYFLYPANSHETFWHVKNPLPDLAAIRACFPILIEMSESLGHDADLRPRWQDILEHLAPYPKGRYLAENSSWWCDKIVDIDRTVDIYSAGDLMHDWQRKNCHPVDTWTIFPFELTHPGSEDYERGLRTFHNRFFPQITSTLAPDMLTAAVLGLGEEARRLLETYVELTPALPGGIFSFFFNDYGRKLRATETGNSVPNMESTGNFALPVNYMMLQGHHGCLRVFPAWPKGWNGAFRLRAEGPVMVEASIQDGTLRHLEIECLKDQRVRLVNPWPEGTHVYDGETMVHCSSDSLLEWQGKAGTIYRLSPVGQQVMESVVVPRKRRTEPRRFRSRVLGIETPA